MVKWSKTKKKKKPKKKNEFWKFVDIELMNGNRNKWKKKKSNFKK